MNLPPSGRGARSAVGRGRALSTSGATWSLAKNFAQSIEFDAPPRLTKAPGVKAVECQRLLIGWRKQFFQAGKGDSEIPPINFVELREQSLRFDMLPCAIPVFFFSGELELGSDREGSTS